MLALCRHAHVTRVTTHFDVGIIFGIISDTYLVYNELSFKQGAYDPLGIFYFLLGKNWKFKAVECHQMNIKDRWPCSHCLSDFVNMDQTWTRYFRRQPASAKQQLVSIGFRFPETQKPKNQPLSQTPTHFLTEKILSSTT